MYKLYSITGVCNKYVYNSTSNLQNVHLTHINAITALYNEDLDLENLRNLAKEDETYQKIISIVLNNKPLSSLPKQHPVKVFQKEWNFIHYDEQIQLLMYNSRIIVPKNAQPQILRNLHLQHLGRQYTITTANMLYYWPTMANDVLSHF